MIQEYTIDMMLSDVFRSQIRIIIIIAVMLFIAHIGRSWWSRLFNAEMYDVNRRVDTLISFGLGAIILFLLRLPLLGFARIEEDLINMKDLVFNFTNTS